MDTCFCQVNRLGKLCTLTNCLDLYFFVDTFCDGAEHGSLHRKVRHCKTFVFYYAGYWVPVDRRFQCKHPGDFQSALI